MGKTALMLNIAEHVCAPGGGVQRNVALFSLEMDGPQLGRRTLSGSSRVSALRMRTGQISDPELIRVHDAYSHDRERLAPEATQDVDVLIHGHDHRYASEHAHGILRFNPGECAGHVRGLNSLGIVDLAMLVTERVRF